MDWIGTNRPMGKQELYDKWVDKVCQYIESVGPKINCTSCAMQSKPVLDKSPQVVFLGYNAHEPFGYQGANKERFYTGNPFFYTERNKWKVWKKLYDAMAWAKCVKPMEDGNFVFMNAVYFGSQDIQELKAKEGSAAIINQCLDYSAEVIQEVYHPNVVVCFSIPDCFSPFVERLHITDVETITPTIIDGSPAWHQVMKAMWNDIKVLGIPHPSGRVSNDDWGAIAMFLKSEL